MKKKLMSLLLVAVMLLGMVPTAMADEDPGTASPKGEVYVTALDHETGEPLVGIQIGLGVVKKLSETKEETALVGAAETNADGVAKIEVNFGADGKITAANGVEYDLNDANVRFDTNADGNHFKWSYADTNKIRKVTSATNAKIVEIDSKDSTHTEYKGTHWQDAQVDGNWLTEGFVINFTVWHTIDSHTVSYVNNGAAYGTPETVKHFATATEPTAPEREGYDFLGWYLDGTEYDFSTPVTDSITLTAKWQQKNYTVTFYQGYVDANGNSKTTQTVNHGEYATAPTVAQDGYNFLGWYLDGDATQTIVDVASYAIVKDTTFQAKWEKLITLTYDANTTDTVTGMPAAVTQTSDDFTVSDATPVREGYNFLGWSMNPDATEAAYTAGAPIHNNKSFTLYAIWQQKTYTVNLFYAGGKDADGKDKDTQTVNHGEYATEPTLTQDGYSFVGWYVEGDVDQTIVELDKYPITKDITFQAKWDKLITLTYDANTTDTVTGMPEAVTQTSATFVISTSEPSRGERYAFLGWSLNPDATEDDDLYAPGETIVCGESKTLYAIWKQLTADYTIEFYYENVDDTDYTLDATKTQTATDFIGTVLNLQPEDVNAIGSKEGFTLDKIENATVTADGKAVVKVYYSRNSYDVAINCYIENADDSDYTLDLTMSNVVQAKYESVFELTVEDINQYLKDNNAEVTLNTEKSTLSATVTTEGATLGLYFDRNRYTATFDPANGDKALEWTFKYGQTLNAPEDPERYGYNFNGWKADDETVTIPGTMPAKNVTFTAQWEAKTVGYTVRYIDMATGYIELYPAETFEAKFDDTITVPAKAILGYLADEQTKQLTITSEETDKNVVTFYYTYIQTPYNPTPVQPQPTTPTNDLKLNTDDHFAYINGYPDGTVNPNGNVTRAEVATILYRIMDEDCAAKYQAYISSYADVAPTEWYSVYVATLENAGVIVDTAKGGSFRPNEAITRAELATMIAQFADVTGTVSMNFSDVDKSHWAANEIAIAAGMGWITGYPDGTFKPDASITRAEMITLINRALNRVPASVDHLLANMVTFPDCTENDWFYIAVQEATNGHTYQRLVAADEQWIALTK